MVHLMTCMRAHFSVATLWFVSFCFSVLFSFSPSQCLSLPLSHFIFLFTSLSYHNQQGHSFYSSDKQGRQGTVRAPGRRVPSSFCTPWENDTVCTAPKSRVATRRTLVGRVRRI